jgi:ParB-like chromosome segregation protein Spo0J
MTETEKDRAPARQFEFHPLADMFPLIEGKAFEKFAENIKAHGVDEPIVLFEGKILDGRNRYLAGVEVGFEVPTWQFVGSEQEAREFVIRRNIICRHLTNEQKRDIIEKLLKADPEKSDRQIAEQAKVDHKTVGAVRAEGEARGEFPHVPKRSDTKGRRIPSTKKSSAQRELKKFKHSVCFIELACENQPAMPVPKDLPDEDREELIRSLLRSAGSISQVLTSLGSDIGEQLLKLVGEGDHTEDDDEDAGDATNTGKDRATDAGDATNTGGAGDHTDANANAGADAGDDDV